MPGHRQKKMGSRPFGRPSTGALLPHHLHLAACDQSAGAVQQGTVLRDDLRQRLGNAATVRP